MADKSKIEWTDATWNPITGCTLVDEGCRHCYAAHLITSWPAIGNHPSRKGLARKNAAGESKFTGEVRFNEQWLDQPLRWRKPRKIFVCAHGDLFHESVRDEWIDKVFAVIALAPQHTFQVLTKRPERARAYLTQNPDNLRNRWYCSVPAGKYPVSVSEAYAAIHPHCSNETRALYCRDAPLWPLSNVWLGTSISDQASADLRVPELLACPAAIRFLSAEPLLGPVDIDEWLHDSDCADTRKLYRQHGDKPLCHCGERPVNEVRLDWVIVGGESGTHARPMHPDWARTLRDQCASARVPFHFKQWGANAWVERIEGDPATITAYRAGKSAAGRLLDGIEHNGFPGLSDG